LRKFGGGSGGTVYVETQAGSARRLDNFNLNILGWHCLTFVRVHLPYDDARGVLALDV
jgi:hypothetical protein